MPKRQGLDTQQAAGLYKPTEARPEAGPGQPAPAPREKKTAIGVALLESEWARMAEIAGKLGMNKHKLAAWALQDFLARYDAGEIPLVNRPSLPKR